MAKERLISSTKRFTDSKHQAIFNLTRDQYGLLRLAKLAYTHPQIKKFCEENIDKSYWEDLVGKIHKIFGYDHYVFKVPETQHPFDFICGQVAFRFGNPDTDTEIAHGFSNLTIIRTTLLNMFDDISKNPQNIFDIITKNSLFSLVDSAANNHGAAGLLFRSTIYYALGSIYAIIGKEKLAEISFDMAIKDAVTAEIKQSTTQNAWDNAFKELQEGIFEALDPFMLSGHSFTFQKAIETGHDPLSSYIEHLKEVWHGNFYELVKLLTKPSNSDKVGLRPTIQL